MGIFKPRAKPDLSLLKGVRAYKPYHPTPEKKVTTEDIIPLNPRLVRPLIKDEPLLWDAFVRWMANFWQNLENGALRIGAIVAPDQHKGGGQSNSALLSLMQSIDREVQRRSESPDRDRTAWGISTREAADVLVSVFGRGSMPATPEPIGDSSDGIDPCGYDAL